MKYYKVTAIEKSKGYRVTVSNTDLSLEMAKFIFFEIEGNPNFEATKIEQSQMKS